MKKLINGVDNVVDEMLRGMAAAHPQYVERVEGTDVMIRTGARKTDKVVLISGGGSGAGTRRICRKRNAGRRCCGRGVHFPHSRPGL